jgi:ribosomal protein L37AE/L43A
MSSEERVAPLYCPYCGDEDLRPSEEGGHGAWECRSCARVFAVKFLGLSTHALEVTNR